MRTGAEGRASRWPRFFRGWAAAGFATFVAALSHIVGGGGTPAVLAVVVSLAFAGIICVGLAGRTLSLWRTSASVVASQLVFHGLFALTGTGGTAAATLVQHGEPGVHQHTLTLSVVGSGSVLAHVGHTAGLSMWAAHAVAAVVTVLALRHGELALRSLLATARLVIRRLLPRLAAAIAPAAPRQVAVSAPVVTAPRRDVLLSPLRHRGPPADLFPRISPSTFA